MNWRDNPWFPEVLERERLEDKQKRPDVYEHIWEGDFKVFSEGAYYTVEMANALHEDRIGRVPYERSVGVVTFAWDSECGRWHGNLVRSVCRRLRCASSITTRTPAWA